MNYAFTAKKLMAPGPVPLPPYVEEIFASSNVHHRSHDFMNVLHRVFRQLPRLFQTSQPTYILPCTGTGAMEAALLNTLNPGDSVLVINAGKFGERWKKIAQAFDIDVQTVTVPWGEAVEVDAVESALKPDTKAVLVQACETSTGVAHPIQEIASLCKNHQALMVVDGITGLGVFDLPMDSWGLDVVLGGSQKGLMLPTGVSVLAMSQKAEALQKKSRFPKYYWDLQAEKVANMGGRTRYSTPVQFVFAMEKVLHEILDVTGLESHFAEIDERARVFREAVQLPLFSKTPSPSLTCLKVPEICDAVTVKNQVYNEYNISIVAGQDAIKSKVLRVGHMGHMTLDDLVETATAINRCL